LAYVKVGENERFENALKRFKKQCEMEGILKEIKKRQYYESPSMLKKKKRDELKRKKRLLEARLKRFQRKKGRSK